MDRKSLDILRNLTTQGRDVAGGATQNALQLFGSAAQYASGSAGATKDVFLKLLESQAQAVSGQIEIWTAGGASTFKVISGDFRPGSAVICMDGLRLRNRGNALEMLPFESIQTIERLVTEKRVSFADRARGAALGGGIGAVSGVLMFGAGASIGSALGGALGSSFLSTGHKFHTCRVTLRDSRKIVAVAANTNWLALMASLPKSEPKRFGLGKLIGR